MFYVVQNSKLMDKQYKQKTSPNSYETAFKIGPWSTRPRFLGQTDSTSSFTQLPIIFGYVENNRRKSPAFVGAKTLAKALPLLEHKFRLSCHFLGVVNTAKGNHHRAQL